MKIKKLLTLFLTILIILIFVIAKIKLYSIGTIIVSIIYSILLISIYCYNNKNKKIFLIISSLISNALFNIFITISINTTLPNNPGDFSLLPVILFIITVPLILITHVLLILNIFNQNKE